MNAPNVLNAINAINALNECPCCSEPLLRHARQGGVYWFCPHCRQEMPNLASALLQSSQRVAALA